MARRRERYLWEGLVNDCKEKLHSGEDRAGFVNTYLRARAAAGHAEAPGRGFAEGDWMQDKFLAFGAGSALEAGSDTSAMNIDSFILYMLNHPHVLKKAREEVDAVVGAERMPEFEDEERLPYLVACIKELLRHRPATPLGEYVGTAFVRQWLTRRSQAYLTRQWRMTSTKAITFRRDAPSSATSGPSEGILQGITILPPTFLSGSISRGSQHRGE